MKVKSIVIVFEKDPGVDGDTEHALNMIFSNGQWMTQGPVYSRYMMLAHEIWQLVRRDVNKDNK